METGKKSYQREGKTTPQDLLCQGNRRPEGREYNSWDISYNRKAVPPKPLETIQQGTKGQEKLHETAARTARLDQ